MVDVTERAELCLIRFAFLAGNVSLFSHVAHFSLLVRPDDQIDQID